MNFIFSLVSVILSFPPLLYSAAMPICPESFSCPNCVPFKYPFYINGTDDRCGLIKIHCTSNCGEIGFGEQVYVIGKVDYGSSIFIHNSTFEELVKTNNCRALLDNFTSPNPLLFSISVAPFITLIKCTNNLSNAQQMSAYFDKQRYNHYGRCKDHSFYYKYLISNTTVPRDLPYTCQVIQLPVKEQWQFGKEVPDETNIFSLLNSYFSISFKYCGECRKKGSQCLAHDRQFQCLDTKKGIYYFFITSSIPDNFMNEVEILTKLRHPNLVVLYGCTTQQSQELLLVYEYIPNGTVADHLHGEGANPSLLTWLIRLNIAIETASALAYLHAYEIIHRDVKTNNILLDHNFCVKVADFGLSRLIPTNVTHVSTTPQGTPGYLDPQYHQCYQLTDKSDVYSFGVVLMELISSMVAIDLSRSREEISLANHAVNRIQRGEVIQLIDPAFRSNSDAKIMRMITSVAELGFLCLQYDSEMRPTMNEVLKVLTDIQAEGRIDAHEKTIEFETLNSQTSSETNDFVILLKDLPPSPVCVNGEWQGDKSASTTLRSSGDNVPSSKLCSILYSSFLFMLQVRFSSRS